MAPQVEELTYDIRSMYVPLLLSLQSFTTTGTELFICLSWHAKYGSTCISYFTYYHIFMLILTQLYILNTLPAYTSVRLVQQGIISCH